MTNSENVLTPGTVVQYRKVGQARLIKRCMENVGSGPEEAARYAETGQGWWTVEWIKAPRVVRERSPNALYWFTTRAIVKGE